MMLTEALFIKPSMTDHRLQEWREKRKLSQRELASATGINQNTIWKLENGEQQMRVQHLKTFARALNVTPIDLLPDEYVQNEQKNTEFMECEAQAWHPAKRNNSVKDTIDTDNKRNYQDFITALLHDNPRRSAWVYKGRSLEHEGYKSGDIFIMDEDVKPQAGDIVCAQIYNNNNADTLFRVFQPPFLLAASSRPEFRAPIMIDTFRVRVVGTVTETFRKHRDE